MAGPGGSTPRLPLILARELASNLATPVFLMDERGMLVYWNDAAELLIGRSLAEVGELSGAEFGEILQLRDVDGSPLRRRDTPTAIAFTDQRAAHRAYRATGYDGAEHALEVTAFPLFGEGHQMHGVVTVFWPSSTVPGSD